VEASQVIEDQILDLVLYICKKAPKCKDRALWRYFKDYTAKKTD
jgi:hypothetical protein